MRFPFLGTPSSPASVRAVLLGSGELGKEIAIELQRLGIETVAVDRYDDAPAMQVAHRRHVVDMLDPVALRRVLEEEHPALIIPEVEAIATTVLADLESQQPWPLYVVPRARAVRLTMDRQGIRRLASEDLGLPTSPYAFARDEESFRRSVNLVGIPCVVKPVMSSSGKGQSVVRNPGEVDAAWQTAQSDGRGAHGGIQTVIVEGFVPFDAELTLLTVRHAAGVTFLDPIRHLQVDGDYAESWQGEPLPDGILRQSHNIARAVVDGLGGWGLYGVELFVVGDSVLFSEVSPRPHDTGMVTLVSQDLSEFALHVRALLGLPVPQPQRFPGAAASVPIKVRGHGVPRYSGIDEALRIPTAQLRLFGKPVVEGERRVGVALARGRDVAEARARAHAIAAAVHVDLSSD